MNDGIKLLKMENNVILWIVWLFVLGIQQTKSFYPETTLLWTQKGLDGRVGIKGIQGNPDTWIKNGIEHTFSSAPLQGASQRLSHRLALGFRYAKKELFFSDINYKDIYKLTFDDVTSRPFKYNKTLEVIYDGTSSMVYGLAIDWVANNIYWTDAMYNWIPVSPIDRHDVVKPLIVTGLDIPFGIACDPHNGYLVWTDYGARSKIERSGLDGSERTILIKSDIYKPRGITIDSEANMLYWVDDAKDTLELADMNGENRQIVDLHSLTKYQHMLLYGVAVFKQYIFITDSFSLNIQIYDKNNLTKIVQNVTTPLAQAYDIMVFDPQLQPTPAESSMSCEELGCDQICLSLGNNQFECECGTGYEIKADGKNCKSKMHQMPQYIYTIGNKLCATPPTLPNRVNRPAASDVYCFHKNLTRVEALAFDSYARYLFYSDNENKEICRIRMDLDKEEFIEKEVLAVQTGTVKGMVVDYIAGNLYWTDLDYNHIMVSRLDGRYPRVLIEDAGQPRGIEIDARNKTLYWSASDSIKRSNLDGSEIEDFMTYKVLKPDGMALDPVKGRLYWTNTMRMTRLENGKEVISKRNITHVSLFNTSLQLSISASSSSSRWKYRDVAVYQDYMVWTDGRGGIHFIINRLTPGTTPKQQIDHDDSDVSHDVIVYDRYLQPLDETKSGACDDENGGCEHLCLPIPRGKTCQCGIGFTLHTDQKSCVSDIRKENFLLFSDPFHKQFYQLHVDDLTLMSQQNLENSFLEPQGLPKDNLQSPQIHDYDQVNEMLYWVEVVKETNEDKFILKRSNLLGQEFNLNLRLNIDQPIGGMVVWNSFLYYMLDGNIYAASLSTGAAHTLYGRGNVFPRTLNVDRRTGTLYWASKGSVEIYSMDLCSPAAVPTVLTRVLHNETMLVEGAVITGPPKDIKMYIWDKTRVFSILLATGAYNEIYIDSSATFQSGGVYNNNIFLSQQNQKAIYMLTPDGVLTPISKPLFSAVIGLKAYGSKNNIAATCNDVTATSTSLHPTSTSLHPTSTSLHPTSSSTQVTTEIPTSSSTVKATTEVDAISSVPAIARGSSPIRASMPEKTVYIVAGVSVVAFFVIVIILSIAYFALRRTKKRKPPPAVHYQPEAHDNPTYMSHMEVSNISRSAADQATPEGATGVSFESLPAKPGAESVSTVSTTSFPVDTSDKAKLVQEEEQSQTVSQPSDVVLHIDGASDSVTASYNNNLYK